MAKQVYDHSLRSLCVYFENKFTVIAAALAQSSHLHSLCFLFFFSIIKQEAFANKEHSLTHSRSFVRSPFLWLWMFFIVPIAKCACVFSFFFRYLSSPDLTLMKQKKKALNFNNFNWKTALHERSSTAKLILQDQCWTQTCVRAFATLC